MPRAGPDWSSQGGRIGGGDYFVLHGDLQENVTVSAMWGWDACVGLGALCNHVQLTWRTMVHGQCTWLEYWKALAPYHFLVPWLTQISIVNHTTEHPFNIYLLKSWSISSYWALRASRVGNPWQRIRQWKMALGWFPAPSFLFQHPSMPMITTSLFVSNKPLWGPHSSLVSSTRQTCGQNLWRHLKEGTG